MCTRVKCAQQPRMCVRWATALNRRAACFYQSTLMCMSASSSSSSVFLFFSLHKLSRFGSNFVSISRLGPTFVANCIKPATTSKIITTTFRKWWLLKRSIWFASADDGIDGNVWQYDHRSWRSLRWRIMYIISHSFCMILVINSTLFDRLCCWLQEVQNFYINFDTQC